MGGLLCSRIEVGTDGSAEADDVTSMSPKSPISRSQAAVGLAEGDMIAAVRHIEAHEAEILASDPALAAAAFYQLGRHEGGGGGKDASLLVGDETLAARSLNLGSHPPANIDQYQKSRALLRDLDSATAFDHRCRIQASPLEQRVDSVIRRLKDRDKSQAYDAAAPRRGHGGQLHPRFPGDHFLSNTDIIPQTSLFSVARRMPKGAHLHIHFNACLPPKVLLDIAKGMDRMFITSNIPLTSDNNFENFNKCEIQFSIATPAMELPGNLFSRGYQPRQTMKFATFLERFPEHFPGATADEWLHEKLVFHEAEAHNLLQTAEGAWEKFNGRTRMMKGLFNYETAYRVYTRKCLEDFQEDNIQYAEIRPNFMNSNQLYYDDGTGLIDNKGIMQLIIDEVSNFRGAGGDGRALFKGLKVIYCTPRSFSREAVRSALEECLQFKQLWPEWIAGFDLVGEEAKGFPISHFVPELLHFQQECRGAGVDIPFLFHCGETLDWGTETDGNLLDALLLNSKRIGHGFALPKHPYIMQKMKARGVCVELCPISNEILGLTPRVSGHAMFQLLANNVHCTVNSDNGTLFRSTLSHDFYQVMVGKADMGIFGWKQLVLWSLDHSCLDEAERASIKADWELRWLAFLQWVVDEYDGDEQGLSCP